MSREAFEAWMKSRGTSLAIEHPQAFEAWQAALAYAYEDAARVCEKRSSALDYGGNPYIRDSNGRKIADAIRARAKEVTR